MDDHDEATQRRERALGVMFALGAYLLWGFFPIYWKMLKHVPSLELLMHRTVWSLSFVMALLLMTGRGVSLWAALRQRPRLLLIYLGASLLIGLNWGLYIWAVNHGFVVETALGYFINPLINVLFGATLLGERARRGQWAAIALAACGVLYLTFDYGRPPWIALTLAVSFACYGLIKKKASLPALQGLALETAWLFLPALGYLIYLNKAQGGAWGQADALTHLMLVGTGAATAIPLLFFAGAVRRLSLTTLGVIQYLAPTIQFLLGVFLYREGFDASRLVGFALIWTGLMLYTVEGLARAKRKRRRHPSSR